MDVLLIVLGVLVILLGLRDIFHSLLHPSGTGAISSRVMVLMWKLSKRSGHRLGSFVGPGAMIAAVLLWVAIQGMGWALIYLPRIPGGFVYSAGIDPGRYNNFLESLYVSLVTLATLGFGDVVATDPWLRMAAPVEALTGFALLTAALTWFTQVYPPLSRRRALALDLKGLADAGFADELGTVDPVTAARVLGTLAAEIAKARIDFTQHLESYYFQEEDPDLSLARQLPYALVLRDAAAESGVPDLRLSSALLSTALDQLAAKLRDFVTADADPASVFSAYAADHGRAPRA